MIEQIAITTRDTEKTKELLGEIFGAEFITDEVEAVGTVFGTPTQNKAELNFSYQLGKFEFEILKYKEGDNWVERNGQEYGMTHLGLHVDDIEAWKRKMSGLGFIIAQEVKTINHTNHVIKGKRLYHYVIFDTREVLGFDLKLIKRLEVEDGSD